MSASVKILIVEDEALLAMLIEHLLKKLGAAVVGRTPSGEEVMELAEALRPDLVLLDIRLRDDLTGIDAARLLRQSMPETRFAFMTAYDTEQDRAQALTLDPLVYLVKPVSENDLKRLLLLAHQG